MAGPLASLRGLSLRPAGSTRVSASKPLPPKQEGKADRQDAASLARAELAADRAGGECLGAALDVEGRRVGFDLLGERLADRLAIPAVIVVGQLDPRYRLAGPPRGAAIDLGRGHPADAAHLEVGGEVVAAI